MSSADAPVSPFAGDGKAAWLFARRMGGGDSEQGVFGCGRRSCFDERMHALTRGQIMLTRGTAYGRVARDARL